MRRFFRAHRDEDYSQIQYLTAKCTRLARDKAVLDRDLLVARDRDRKLQNHLEAAAARLRLQEQVNGELREREELLIGKIHRQQDLVDLLQQRVVLLAEASSRDGELLRQVGSELLSLQSSEVQLEGLVDELHAEAQRRAEVAEGLQTELRAEAQRRAALTGGLQAQLLRKSVELEKLQETNQTLSEELKELRSAHHKEVRELQQENQASLRKLQGTAEQFEWLCEQQRYWMCCVKRFKDSLMEERDALLRQVITLKKKAEKLKRSLGEDSDLCPLLDAARHDSGVTSWDADAVAALESQVESSMLYAELFHQKKGNDVMVQAPPPSCENAVTFFQ